MKKDLLQALTVFCQGTSFYPRQLLKKASLLYLIIFLLTSRALAQQIQPGALKQIQSLMAEKQSRTPAQKKISSQILYSMLGCQPITVVNITETTGINGIAFRQTFTQSGAVGHATFTLHTGALPNGLTLSADGVLSGRPSAPAGIYTITVKVTGGNGCTGVAPPLDIEIKCQAITVHNPEVTTGIVEMPFSQTFTAPEGIGLTLFSLAGHLPRRMLFGPPGVLSGTPEEPGVFPLIITATDENGCHGVGSPYVLEILCETITVTNPENTTGALNEPFSENFSAPGHIFYYGESYIINTGTLPAGLTLDYSGHLSGIPLQSGTFPITIKASDGIGCTGISAPYNLVIGPSNQRPVIINTTSGSDLTGVPAGALLVLTTTNNTNATPYDCIVTSVPSLTWTKRADAGAKGSNNAEIWTAVFAAGGNISVTSDWGTASHVSVLYTVTGAESVLGGASGTGISQSSPSVSVTTTRANSILFSCTSDWNGIDGATRVLRDGATDRYYFRNAAKGYTAYYYTKATTSTGTYTEGILSPGGQKAATAVLEIRRTAPAVTSVSPLNGATGVVISTSVSAVFNEAMDGSTLNTSTVELLSPSNVPLPATVSYNAGTKTATLTLAATLANSTVYTARIKGGEAGVKDAAGNVLAGDYIWSFTTAAAPCQPTVLNADTKASVASATVHSLTGVPAGALLVLTTTNNTNAAPYNCIITSSPSLTWTKRVDAGAASSNNAEIWTAVFSAGGNITVTSNWGAVGQASVLYTVTGAEAVLGGASGIGTSQTAPSVAVTTTRANSILFGCTSDWNGINGAARVLRDGATDRYYFRNPAKGYTAYYYTKVTTSAGTYTEGVSSPTGQKASTAVLEIRCPGAVTRLADPVTAIAEKGIYSLGQNYPNPVSGETTIQFKIPKAEKVNLSLYDINGRVVKVLLNGSRDAGIHTVNFNAGSFAGGVYYYRMRAGDFIDAKKLTIQR